MFLLLIIVSLVYTILARPTEEERVRLWYEAGNTWPPKWQPESEAMKLVLKHREDEIMSLAGTDERWENWLQFTQNRLVPKFTSRGFDVIDIPIDIYQKLRQAVEKPLENFESMRSEGIIDVIYHRKGYEPKFFQLGSLTHYVHQQLKDLHQQWAGGIELMPTSAYGIRFYQNGSSLVTHYDKVGTHVISSIVHVAHQYDNDNEPWPIQIEDHDGTLHSVNLKEGQMLFYESAKCLHGRLTEFKGKYYGSIFLHYQPVDQKIWNYSVEDIIASIPPHWRDDTITEHGDRFAGAAITVDSRASVLAPPRKTSLPLRTYDFENEL